MVAYVRDSSNGLWYVQTNDSVLGPFPKKVDADEIAEAIEVAREQGKEEVRAALRELLGVQVVHVGN